MAKRSGAFLWLLCVVFSVFAQQAPPIPGLVGFWSFNGNADDASEGGRNGSVSGASLVADRHGVADGAYSFDGVNDRITLSSDLVLDLDQGFTISSWHKIATGDKTTWSAFIGKSLSEGGKMMFHSGGNVTFYQDYINPDYFIWTSGVNLGEEIPFDEWFHLAIVVKRRPDEGDADSWDEINVKIYIDGVMKAENNNMDATPDIDVFNILYLGRVNNRYYEGLMDDVAVFDQPLTTSQVEELGTYQPGDGTFFTTTNGMYFENGNVAIGTTDTEVDGVTYRLAVDGSIVTKEINLTVTDWPDYVFDPDYELESLESIKSYVEEHHHLPDVPSASEVHTKGANVGDLNKIFLRKIEELTLHLIDLNKELSDLKSSNKALKKEIEEMKNR